MCVVSMVGDHYNDKWKKEWPSFPQPWTSQPVSREEFNKLQLEVLEMKKLLERAVEYDARTNQPNCEIEDKVKVLKDVAKLVGVDLKDIFKG